jgi:DNA polymerase III delta prime subunit
MLSGTRPATLEDILHTSPRNVFVFSSFGESFKIEKVREIIAKSTLKTDAAFQVFILVSPELLTLEAANALLKTFEEVPDRTLFLLCGESFEKLPSTLRSRILYLSENRHQYWESPLHTTLVDALCRGDAFPLL